MTLIVLTRDRTWQLYNIYQLWKLYGACLAIDVLYLWFSSYMNLLFIAHNLGITRIVLYPE